MPVLRGQASERQRSRENLRNAVLQTIAQDGSVDIRQINRILTARDEDFTEEDLQRELARLYEDGEIIYSGGRFERTQR